MNIDNNKAPAVTSNIDKIKIAFKFIYPYLMFGFNMFWGVEDATVHNGFAVLWFSGALIFVMKAFKDLKDNG